MASYRYERDIDPKDIAPRKERQYTRKERWANWWDYNLKWVIIIGIAAAFVAYNFIGQYFFVTKPDYNVAVVAPYYLPEDTVNALQDALAAYGEDRNGDGKVVVTLNVYTLDYSDTTLWRQVGVKRDAAKVEALVSAASIHSAGAVSLTASSSQAIDAQVIAGAAAIGLALCCLWFPPRLCAALALAALLVQLYLLNEAAIPVYHEWMLSTAMRSGFRRFYGMAQWLGWCWPWLAVLLLARRTLKPPR